MLLPSATVTVVYGDDLQAGAAALLALLRAPREMASSPVPHDDPDEVTEDPGEEAA